MITVSVVSDWLSDFAPLSLAESWDNVGLLLGDPAAEVKRVMTCLTVTPRTVAEAVTENAGLIVSHHPILFKPTQRITADTTTGRMLLNLAAAGIAVYSPHTAFDNTRGGINDWLASKLGLVNVRGLRSMPPRPAFKIVVFTPETDRGPVLAAAFEAGAGRIGAYQECSFSSLGQGTFFGLEGTNPALGESGRRENVTEQRVEILCPGHRLSAVLAAIRGRHSYEEPAIDVYPLHASDPGPGLGRVGRLFAVETLRDLARRAGQLLATSQVSFVGDPYRIVEHAAIVCGAGDDFLPDAVRHGADVLITGEARLHRGLEADALGIGLLLLGHHASERPAVEELAQRLASAFPTLELWASRGERDPFQPA